MQQFWVTVSLLISLLIVRVYTVYTLLPHLHCQRSMHSTAALRLLLVIIIFMTHTDSHENQSNILFSVVRISDVHQSSLDKMNFKLIQSCSYVLDNSWHRQIVLVNVFCTVIVFHRVEVNIKDRSTDKSPRTHLLRYHVHGVSRRNNKKSLRWRFSWQMIPLEMNVNAECR